MRPHWLWLDQTQADALLAHARAGFPLEVCGLLLGQGNRVLQVVPVENVADDPRHYYRMDERALARHLSSLSGQGLALLGFYHSHPHSRPTPSDTDIAQAHYPDTPYLIVSLNGAPAAPADMAAWLIRDGEVTPVPLHVGQLPPPPGFTDQIDTDNLTTAQKAAIITAMIFGLLIVVGLSIMLLPPAPEIPR